jgi:hypothetical protein
MLSIRLLVITACAVSSVYTVQAMATASIGGVISVVASSGVCGDSALVPGNTAQDTFLLSGNAACNGEFALVDLRGDAASASVGLLASASGNGFGSSQAAAQVSFTDHWLLTPPVGTAPGTSINIPVSLSLDGDISAGAVFHPGFGRFLDYNLKISDLYGPLSPGGLFSAIGSISATGPYSQTFNGSVNFFYFGGTSLPMTAVVELSLSVPGLLEGTIDFYNTASVSIDLPPGFTATTSSGVPLDVADVPLPTAPALFAGLGLACLIVSKRQWRC